MKYAIFLLCLFPFVSLASSKEEVIDYLSMVSRAYKIDTGVFVATAICESGLNPNAIGDGGRAKNIFQFHAPTFRAFSQEVNVPDLEYNNWRHQAWLAAWGFANGKKSHWTCFKQVVRA